MRQNNCGAMNWCGLVAPKLSLLLINSVIKVLLLALTVWVLLGSLFQLAYAQNSIKGISASSVAGVGTIVTVEMAQPLGNPPKDFAIGSPPRIAFDFQDTTNELGTTIKEFAEGGLRSANVVQAGNRTRLVINLEQMHAYETKVDGNVLQVTLKSKKVASSGVVSEANTTRFAGQKAGTQEFSLLDVDFRRGRNGEGRVQIDLSDPSVSVDIRQQGTALVLDFMNASLPANLQKKLDVLDFGTPVQTIDTYAQGDKVRMMIEPKGTWEHAVYQTDNRLVVEVKEVVIDPDKLGRDSKGAYTGDKLTLNFQKIDVREALNVIADFTNLNMVISDSVSGNLTLRLKDVPWDQAFDIILQSRGLDMRKNGNVIQVAPSEEIASKEKVSLAAKNEISELEELRTESFRLSYQTVDDMVGLLTNAKQPMLSKRGSAVSDSRTSTIFVKDTPARLEEVRKMIKKIDVPVRQVMIEARFVSAKDDFNYRLGAKLGFTDTSKGFAIGSNGPSAIRGKVDSFGSNVNLPVTSIGSFSLFNAASTKVLKLELAASEMNGATKSIASPRVVTKDRVAAKVSAGTQIPYQEKTSSGATSTAFMPATLSLSVTPQITPDDQVNMKIDAKQDVVGAQYGGADSPPSVDTKQVTTEVRVENGGTVVIGGVFTQESSDGVNKVPVLGDIPIFGWAFKQKTQTDVRNELLIFITPKIMQDALNIR